MKIINLTNSNDACLVDDEDYTMLSLFDCWQKTKDGHAKSGSYMIHMHRLLFGLYWIPIPEGLVVDHIDQNPLNNTKDNLRLVSRIENKLNCGKSKNNTSGYRGVFISKSRRNGASKWEVCVRFNKIPYSLGYFKTARMGAIAYDVFWDLLGVDYVHKNVENPSPEEINVIKNRFKRCKRNKLNKLFKDFSENRLDNLITRNRFSLNNLIKLSFEERVFQLNQQNDLLLQSIEREDALIRRHKAPSLNINNGAPVKL